MKMAAKMLLMRNGGQNNSEMRGENRGEMQNEMRGAYMEQEEMESRFRDRRGREHYENGRYAPKRSEMRGEQERRFEYTERRGENSGEAQQRSEMHSPYVPPYYTSEPQQRRIGFALEGNSGNSMNEVGGAYRAAVDYPRMNEVGYRGRSEMSNGHAESKEEMHFDKQVAEKWMENVRNDDGTYGPHWPFEKVQQVMQQHDVKCDPVEFYATINMMYSDYSKVAKDLGVNNMDFYVKLSKAFLEDKDAPKDKLARYYKYIVSQR